jgi:hypothetical protein
VTVADFACLVSLFLLIPKLLYAILIFDFGTVPTERHCLVQIGNLSIIGFIVTVMALTMHVLNCRYII